MDIRKFFHPTPSTPNVTVSNDNPVLSVPEPKQMRIAVDEEHHVKNVLDKPSVCTQDQFQRWRLKWTWLDTKELTTGEVGVICSICTSVGSLKTTAVSRERIEVEQRWLSGITAKNSKKLHDKISEHLASKAHSLCTSQLSLQKKDIIKQSFQHSNEIWRKQNMEKIEITKRVFNTAYTIARKNIPFNTHAALVEMQKMNGVDMGKVLFSNHSCGNIITYIAQSMVKKLVEFVLESDSYFSILLDESTTCSNLTALIVYLRITGPDGEPCNSFFSLVELEGTRGVDIANALYRSLIDIGFPKNTLTEKLLGICTDGASNLQGEYNGAITLFLEMIGRADKEVVKMHCMNHKLELAVHKVVDDINQVLHIRQFVDTLYAFFSQSPKNQRALELVARELQAELLKIGRIFDIRWLSSTYRSINALWKCLPSLCKFFQERTLDSTISSKDQAKATGMLRKMQNWSFAFELALLRDSLDILQNLSLFLQRRDSSLLNAQASLQIALKSLTALKSTNGLSLEHITDEYDNCGTVLGMKIQTPDEKHRTSFSKMRGQFLQGLIDNLRHRFPHEGLLQAGAALDPDTWPDDDVQKAFYGDKEVLRLAQLCDVSCSTVLDEYRQYKQNVKKIGVELAKLLHRVQLLPVSSSECERGFSSMNLDNTAARNRLQIQTLSSLIFIKVNGPPATHFQAENYVIDWIKSGHHAATDMPTGKKQPQHKPLSAVSKLF